MTEIASLLLLIIILILLIIPGFFMIYGYFVDRNQQRHSVLKNYPLIGRMRYFFESIGPELRQYLFTEDNSGKPFSRKDYQNIVLPAKYNKRMVGFGSQRDFDQPGYYIKNTMYPKLTEELAIEQSPVIESYVYNIEKEYLFSRKEYRTKTDIQPYLLDDDHVIVIGENCPNPFQVKGLIGMSGMSYGALGDRAITALSLGLGRAGGTWMNTGEGGVSDYHLKGNVDLIMQIGPGLFGVRTHEGEISWEELKKKANIEQVKAFELKLAQGAKTRGGHVEADKVTQEIAEIRNIPPYQTVDSPNRFKEFDDPYTMLEFIERIRDVAGKPVGIKIVVGQQRDVDDLARAMKETGKAPDFISVDGGEGGTGATYQELADSVGLPIKSAIPILHQALIDHNVRDRVKIIASGKLFTPDRIAVALALGADLIQLARAFMVTVGCILAQVCHTNHCPVGVATTDSKLQQALDIKEKSYRVTNYVVSVREGLYNIAASAGLESPTEFKDEHVSYKDLYDVIYENHLMTSEK
ncbi:FMN-binding glutamate synthase family protein [Tenuibacillus multivorans]|uniref:Glutamate synthase (Ferredoxin) n=1 Tax=Tenuibacillus multivorans TaxID=237069 RepID=A0A1G9WWA2_9BACI|nr:FMN-binding glutamate synthase family protein [Tenuibacillus multivorans]GEL78402.1 glutamate synthase large subunit-like protein YerD [Tenuibacillus multivorans]SDM88709.1 glutamate synthase (ferredoxin) [Tenuibacillus multivorans]